MHIGFSTKDVQAAIECGERRFRVSLRRGADETASSFAPSSSCS